MMDRRKREHGDGLTTACCTEDPGTCEEDSEEEHPYTCVALDECVYDLILGQEEEKRKHCRSFIMNRPPAPAPRPLCSPSREENTPYIVQGWCCCLRNIFWENIDVSSLRGVTFSKRLRSLFSCLQTNTLFVSVKLFSPFRWAENISE